MSVGKMSVQENIPSENCPFGELSVQWIVGRGTVSWGTAHQGNVFGKLSVGKCPSAKRQSGNCSDTPLFYLFLYIIVTYAVLVSSGKSVFEMSLLTIFVLYAPIVLAAVLKSFGGFPSEHPFLLGFNEFINVSKSAGLTFGSPNTSVCL